MQLVISFFDDFSGKIWHKNSSVLKEEQRAYIVDRYYVVLGLRSPCYC